MAWEHPSRKSLPGNPAARKIEVHNETTNHSPARPESHGTKRNLRLKLSFYMRKYRAKTLLRGRDSHYLSRAMRLRASMNRRTSRTSVWPQFPARAERWAKAFGLCLSGILAATAFAFAQAPGGSKNNQAIVKP